MCNFANVVEPLPPKRTLNGLTNHNTDPPNYHPRKVQVFKFSFYVIFFAVMFSLYGVPPLNLIRDIYMSFDQLQRRLQAFYRFGSARLGLGPGGMELGFGVC